MADSIDQQIRLDLANETVRCYGELPEDFPQKMAKRLKRKFHSSLDTATILALGEYPHEDRTIVKTVCDWLIYYEYLK